jgi:hypothetical protein
MEEREEVLFFYFVPDTHNTLFYYNQNKFSLWEYNNKLMMTIMISWKNVLTTKSPFEELDSPAVSALGVRSRKLSNAHNSQSWDGWPKPYHLELLRASEGMLIRWSRLHLQSLAPTNPHLARVVGYGLFSLWLIHKEGLCPSSEDINRLMMMMTKSPFPFIWFFATRIV